MNCSTCFGHLYAHHQELETILVLLPHMVCNAARMKIYNVLGSYLTLIIFFVLAALHTIRGNNTSIVSRSWWGAHKCPKHVQKIISAIKRSVASSWFSSLRLYNDARTNIHQIQCIYPRFLKRGCQQFWLQWIELWEDKKMMNLKEFKQETVIICPFT